MREQTRNTEVQIGKLPEKESRVVIVKVIKTLENKMEKVQELINKGLEAQKNIKETIRFLKLKIRWMESIAEYLKQKKESVSWKIKW